MTAFPKSKMTTLTLTTMTTEQSYPLSDICLF